VFKEFSKEYSLINLDVSKFIDNIEKTNQRGERVTDNQISKHGKYTSITFGS
jgi:hypothetical protein